MANTIAKELLRELETEEGASRNCIARVPESAYEFKPHEKSMAMGYLTLIVAEIPKWIAVTIEKGVIDLSAWEKFKLSTSANLLKYYEDNLTAAKKALNNATDEQLEEVFNLKMGETVLMTSSKKDSVGSSINHLVHHRGQLTVYMRLNGIAVPSIYGPSADEKSF